MRSACGPPAYLPAIDAPAPHLGDERLEGVGRLARAVPGSVVVPPLLRRRSGLEAVLHLPGRDPAGAGTGRPEPSKAVSRTFISVPSLPRRCDPSRCAGPRWRCRRLPRRSSSGVSTRPEPTSQTRGKREQNQQDELNGATKELRRTEQQASNDFMGRTAPLFPSGSSTRAPRSRGSREARERHLPLKTITTRIRTRSRP